jgi:putative ABC transport system ATP-binding protein
VDALIELGEVTKQYAAGGAPALDHVSLDVAAGEAVAVMGPSGSGKSTLLNLVAGLDKPTSATVTVAGQRIGALPETRLARYRRTRVGMVFQFFNLLDDLTVAGNVLLPAQVPGTPRGRARTQRAELLDQFGIARFRDTYLSRLSGGERQVCQARQGVKRRSEYSRASGLGHEGLALGASRSRPTAVVGVGPWRGGVGQIRIVWQVITTLPCGIHT